jgi:hypothetical protein
VKPGDPDAMLSMLRSAGARGVTRDELYDTLNIRNPTYLVQLLELAGHSVLEQPENTDRGGLTSRFTLMVDGADQRPMFEGEATGQLGTWHADPVHADELRARSLTLGRSR